MQSSGVISQVYVQLHPNDPRKIIFQIRPDQNYADVDAYINFYSNDGKLIRKENFEVTDEKNRYIKKDVCTNRVFTHRLHGVTAVSIDHISCNETRGKSDNVSNSKKINIPASNKTIDSDFIKRGISNYNHSMRRHSTP